MAPSDPERTRNEYWHLRVPRQRIISAITKSGRQFCYDVTDYRFSERISNDELRRLCHKIMLEKYRLCGWDKSHDAVNARREIVDALYQSLSAIIEKLQGLAKSKTRHSTKRGTRVARTVRGETVRTLRSGDRYRRIVIFRRQDRTYGFAEDELAEDGFEDDWMDRFSDEALEEYWIPFRAYINPHCASEEIAVRQAIARVGWLGEMVAGGQPVDGLPDRYRNLSSFGRLRGGSTTGDEKGAGLGQDAFSCPRGARPNQRMQASGDNVGCQW